MWGAVQVGRRVKTHVAPKFGRNTERRTEAQHTCAHEALHVHTRTRTRGGSMGWHGQATYPSIPSQALRLS